MALAAIISGRIITCQIRQMEERRQGTWEKIRQMEERRRGTWEKLNIPGDGTGAMFVGSRGLCPARHGPRFSSFRKGILCTRTTKTHEFNWCHESWCPSAVSSRWHWLDRLSFPRACQERLKSFISELADFKLLKHH